MLHQQYLLYIPEIIKTKLIIKYNIKPLASYLEYKKIQNFVTMKYYKKTLY